MSIFQKFIWTFINNKMKKIILTRGIPASGKSTQAKQEVLKDLEHSIRINRDK